MQKNHLFFLIIAVASTRGTLSMERAWPQKRAAPEEVSSEASKKEKENNEYMVALARACVTGNVPVVRECLVNGLANCPIFYDVDPSRLRDLLPDNEEFDHYLTPLECAAHYNRIELARYLISRDALKGQETRGMRALERAAGAGHIEMVQLLIQAGANNRYAANTALSNRRYQILTLILSHCHAERIILANSLINRASGTEDPETTSWFLSFISTQGPHAKELALYEAAGANQVAVVKLLLQEGADVRVDPADQALFRALRYSADNHLVPCVALLLEAGASAIVGDRHHSPLDVAWQRHCCKAAEMILVSMYENDQINTIKDRKKLARDIELQSLNLEAVNDPILRFAKENGWGSWRQLLATLKAHTATTKIA